MTTSPAAHPGAILRAKLRAIRDDDPIETHRGLGYSIRGKAS